MLALDVSHFDDRRLCQLDCKGPAISVAGPPQCAGLCNPVEDLLTMYNSTECNTLTTTDLPMLPPRYFSEQT